jgi:sugar lactone lactonase YvrE
MLMAGALRKTAVGDAKHRFARPHDIHIDSRGRVLVTDPGNHRIQILDRDLNRSGVLSGPPYGFNEPKYLASDAEGRVYIADEYNHRILILDREDKPAGQIGTGERGKGPNRFNQPEGVTVWRGRIWISDTYNDRIVLYRLTD